MYMKLRGKSKGKRQMILKRLKIETMIGNYTNCYVIADEEKGQSMVIDPAGDVDRIIETIDLLQVSIKYIYLTHCHADHTSGLVKLKEKTNARILIHRYEYELLFTGDTLFKGTYGRYDLPTGNYKDIMSSIKNKLLTLPDETVIYPGHGDTGLLIEEKTLYI